MGAYDFPRRSLDGAAGSRRHETDVLVIGGGPAGCWAAIAARARGARAILVDKGYCGSSGATAPSGTGVWHVAPNREARAAARDARDTMGGHLASHAWMDRVLDQTYANLQTLAEWGYPFPVDDEGIERRNSLQGPEYMRLMRKRVKQSGAQILDQSPALELLVDYDGHVAGAAGVNRLRGDSWVVRAGAVVIASGGCAFLSGALGCNVLTGDGYLMAAEVGAQFSGMEFSCAYGLGPAFSSVTKSLFYNWATFRRADGSIIEGAGSQRGRSVIARTLMTEPVFAILDRADDRHRAWMRNAQPNFFLSFDRAGIDPFTQMFPVALRLEGTVRGTGGIRLAAEDCATDVPGLYASGDAATRELICGGFTGGGSHNAAWAMSSGFWSGAGAAEHARARKSGASRLGLLRTGGPALRDFGHVALAPDSVIARVQAQVFPFENNYFRSGERLGDSLSRLDDLWREVRATRAPDTPVDAVRAREAVAMLATARLMYASALARTETRGMHRRDDHPQSDPAQRHHILAGGLDHVWTRPGPLERAAETVPDTVNA